MAKEDHPTAHGQTRYHAWRERLRATPGYQAIDAEEAAQSALWLQRVEARQQAGVTQKELAERAGG